MRRDINTLDGFMDAQAGGIICGRHGHSNKIVLPVQKRDETREVLCRCSVCRKDTWVTFSREGYRRFLEDLAAGKIK